MALFASRKKTIIFSVLILLLLVGTSWRQLNKNPLRGAVLWGTKPFASFFSMAGYWLNEKASFWKDISKLKQDNSFLLEENAALKAQLARLKDVEQENNLLRQEMKLAPRDKYALKPALIIRKNITASHQLLFLDKGSADGIKKGMAVIVHQGILVGQITETFKQESIAELIFSPKSNIIGEVLGSTAKGIVRGEYGTTAVLDMIPRNLEIKEGDMVITSGSEELIPRGLLVGQVKEIAPTADLLFQKATLTLPFQADKLRLVWIVVGSK